MAKERKWQLAVVVFPLEVQLSEERAKYYQETVHLRLGSDVGSGRPQTKIQAFFEEYDIPVVDLLPVYRQHDPSKLFLKNKASQDDPVHPSVLGHQLAGQEVARVLLENNVRAPTRSGM